VPVPPVVAGLCRADSIARGADTDRGGQLGDRGIGHGVDPGSVSALSESVSKLEI
jgi:hypothetical protein